MPTVEVVKSRQRKSTLPVAKAKRKRTLPAAARATMWKPGKSANPGGFPANTADVRRLAREHTIDAMNRIIWLMHHSNDDRVALVAAEKILERAFGRPKEEDPKDRPPMTRERILELLRYASTLGQPSESGDITDAEVVDVTPTKDEEETP